MRISKHKSKKKYFIIRRRFNDFKVRKKKKSNSEDNRQPSENDIINHAKYLETLEYLSLNDNENDANENNDANISQNINFTKIIPQIDGIDDYTSFSESDSEIQSNHEIQEHKFYKIEENRKTMEIEMKIENSTLTDMNLYSINGYQFYGPKPNNINDQKLSDKMTDYWVQDMNRDYNLPPLINAKRIAWVNEILNIDYQKERISPEIPKLRDTKVEIEKPIQIEPLNLGSVEDEQIKILKEQNNSDINNSTNIINLIEICLLYTSPSPRD